MFKYYKFTTVYQNGHTEVKLSPIKTYAKAKSIARNLRRPSYVRQCYFKVISKADYLTEKKKAAAKERRDLDKLLYNKELNDRLVSEGVRSIHELKNVYIYALVRADRIVYIGQSVHPLSRIKEHIKTSDKLFDGWKVLGKIENAERANEIEANYIKELRPQYNVVHKPTVPKAKAYFGKKRSYYD